MIADVNRGHEFDRSLLYLLQEKKQAKIVYCNFSPIDSESIAGDIAEQFENQTAFNRRVQKPLYHVSISPSYYEASQMNNVVWSELIDDFVKEMGFSENMIFGVVHNDTYFEKSNKPRPHVHLIVNTVNVQSNKCTDIYYDYQLAKNFLAGIEEDLSIKREEAKQHKVEKLEEELSPNLEGGKSIDFDKLDYFADKIKTNDHLNGIDLSSYAITSISSLAKVASLFLLEAQKSHKEEEAKKEEVQKLKAILKKTEDLKLLESSLGNNPRLPPFTVEKDNPKALLRFLEKAEDFIESVEVVDAKHLLPSTVDKTPTIKAKDEVFDKFVNYFHAIDDLNQKPHQEKYLVKGKALGKVELNDSTESKSISIEVQQVSVYQSEFNSDSRDWSAKNNLSQNQKLLIDNLPQTKEEVAKKHLEIGLANYLDKEFDRFDRLNITSKIGLHFKTESDLEDLYLQFDRLKPLNGKSQSLRGTDSQGKTVFEAEISPNKAISIGKNDISVKALQDFVRWQKSRSQSQSQEKKRKQ